MLALLQRVTESRVEVNSKVVGQIKKGLLIFLGIEKEDTEETANRLLEKIVGYRIFPDHQDRMNLSIKEIQGELLFVPQFTLAANTKKGLRPSFTPAADPKISHHLFYYIVEQAKKTSLFVETGEFGGNMQVYLCNDGPVTFLLR